MNLEQLKKGQILSEIIKRTENGLDELKAIQVKRKSDDRKDHEFDDGQYNFVVGRYKGSEVDLTRYKGNAELLDVIITTLEKQLNDFKEEFQNL